MSDLSTLLPPNASTLEKSIAKCCIGITNIDVPFVALKNPDLCPVKFLPWLAWERRVEFWDTNWSEAQKRTAIKNAKTFNQQRGTRAALQQAIDQFGDGWQIIPWHLQTPKGVPFTFLIKNATELVISVDVLETIENAIDATKSARDIYFIDAQLKIQCKQYQFATAHSIERIHIGMRDSASLLKSIQFITATVHSVERISLATKEAA